MDMEKIEAGVRMILEGVGEDPNREGLLKTPARVARMYEEVFAGLTQDPAVHFETMFDEGHREMVLVKDIPFYSMCEHHLVPFFGKVSIAYQPHDGMVAGFSKFTKLVERISHRPQLQERMTQQIADAITEGIGADGVLVIVDAQQLCMTMRGAVAHDSRTITSACTGCLNSDGMKKQAWIMLGMRDEEK